MAGQHIRDTEFSPLLDNRGAQTPQDLRNKPPSIAPAGLHIVFPRQRIDDFLPLLTAEWDIKREFIALRQPVCSLRLQGYPLRQCSGDALTELLFRLCSSREILDAGRGERCIDLDTEQCSSDNLALLKGLGFTHVRLRIDASRAGPDHSLCRVRRSVTNALEFGDLTLSAQLGCGPDTSRNYLKKLLAYLFECEVMEIEFSDGGTHSPAPAEFHLTRDTFKSMMESLRQANYQLIGDRCFKRSDHPDLQWLGEGKLGYGPWGFYHLRTAEWLGLGPGAEGLIGGYLCHNSSDIDIWRRHLERAQSPISSWSRHPINGDRAFAFIQQLYCEHRVDSALFRDREPLLAIFKRRRWLDEQPDFCALTDEGRLHLHSVCSAYSLYDKVHSGD